MQQIEILSATVSTKSGTSAKTGNDYSMREQPAALHDSDNKYPQACRITLGKDQPAYAVGMYEITSPFSVGQWESLQINRDFRLVLLKKAA